MIKQIIQRSRLVFSLLLAVIVAAGCSDDSMIASGNQNLIDENGMIRLTIRTDVPAWQVARAVDTGGEGIANLWVLTFNEEGNMINRVLATDVTHNNAGNVEADQSGNFTVEIPAATRIIHLLGNVIMDNFSDRDNIGRHENEVIGDMVSSSGALTFWGRHTFADEKALTDFAQNGTGGPVVLYRNQAIVRYQNDATTHLTISGMCICNRKAYGTVAPFNREQIDNAFNFALETNEFVTQLPEKYDIKQSDPEDVYTMSGIAGDPRYVFENMNPDNDQLYAIFRIAKAGGVAKYYKVMLVNDQKTPYQIIRNHLYTITFSDINESYGVGSFAEAHGATPANNPLVVVRDEVPDVSYGDRTLAIVGETTRLYQQETDGPQVIEYTYDGEYMPDITWINNEGVADAEITNTWDSATKQGSLTIQVHPAGEEVKNGTLLIKEQNGPLSRRIKIITAPKFDFGPVWVSSEIPLLEDEAITILFNVPANYPDELLPDLEVKFASNLIDGKKGESFRIIDELTKYTVPVLKDPMSTTVEWVYETVEPDWNYKYVYDEAHTKGRHRANFRTLLTNITNVGVDELQDFHIYMEDGNGYFKTRDLYFAFQHKGEDRRIMLDGGDADNNYVTRTINNLNPVNGETVTIPFTLGTLNNGNMVEQNPVTSTIMVYFDPTVLKPNFTDEPAKEGLFGNYYVAYQATQPKNTLTFTTISPNYDSYVVLSAKSQHHYNNKYDNTGVNPSDDAAFRSASVTLRSTGRLNFNPVLSPTAIPYGIGQKVNLTVDIPTNIGTHSYTIKLGTSNLKPTGAGWTQWPESEQGGNGYDYIVPEGHSVDEMTFEFETTRIVSAETLSLSSSGNVAFNDATVKFTNTPLQGSILLPDGEEFGAASPYVMLQRRDGTRIGIFRWSEDLTDLNTATYSLSLQGEYDLNPNDYVNIIYSPVNSNKVYINEVPYTLADLLELETPIQLVERQ